MSEQGKVNINSRSISSGIQCTPRAARMYTQLRFCLLEGRQSNKDCPGGDTAVNMDWPGPYRNSGPYTCSFILFIIETKQEYIIQSTSVVRKMSAGIFLQKGQTFLPSLWAGTTHLGTLPAAEWCTPQAPLTPKGRHRRLALQWYGHLLFRTMPRTVKLIHHLPLYKGQQHSLARSLAGLQSTDLEVKGSLFITNPWSYTVPKPFPFCAAQDQLSRPPAWAQWSQ